MEKNEYIPYDKIADYLEIQSGDVVYLASEVLGLARECKLNNEKFNADVFINSIINKIGENGTLFIPTFNWDFSNKGFYDYKKSLCTTGSLGKAALRRSDFKRTKHPMHSFAVWGKNKEKICSVDAIDSYDGNTPFKYMMDNLGKCIIVGTDYKHAYTFIHFVECKERVPFRFFKNFEGIYIDENQKKEIRTYSSYVRYLDITLKEKFNEIGEVFESVGVARTKIINKQPIKIVDMKASYSIIANDIHNNYCRNLYKIEKRDFRGKKNV